MGTEVEVGRSTDLGLVESSYEAWNQALADFFYKPSNAGRPVYLQVDGDNLRAIGRSVGVTPDRAEHSFERAVQAKLNPGSKVNPFAELLWQTSRWRRRVRSDCGSPPPFLGLLGACVLAASRMSSDPERGIASNDYYQRLRSTLGLDLSERGQPPSFDKVTTLWATLRYWLQELNQGALGLPTAKRHPRLTYVGYPISQCLLRRVDREKLPDFFGWAGLSPGEEISGESLAPSLAAWASSAACTLTRRGKAVLTGGDEALTSQAADLASADLWHWDGSSVDLEGRRWARIELQVEVSRGGRRLGCSLLSRAPEGFPEGSYRAGLHAAVELQRQPGGRWFEPLPEELTGEALRQGLKLRNGRYALACSPPDVIVLGAREDLTGWISCGRVGLGETHLVLCRRPYEGSVRDYLADHAEPGWVHVPGARGLPPSWSCFRHVLVSTIPAVTSPWLECLIPRPSVGISLKGGLKVGDDEWIVGGEPEAAVAVQGGHPVMVSIDGQETGFLEQGSGLLKLGDLGLSPGRHEITVGTHRRSFGLRRSGRLPVELGEDGLVGRAIRHDGLAFTPVSLDTEVLASVDEVPQHQLLLFGAKMIGRPQDMPPPLEEMVMLPRGYRRYVILGRRPGDVVEHHAEGDGHYQAHLKPSGANDARLEVPVPFVPQWLVKIGPGRRQVILPVGEPESPDPATAEEGGPVHEWARWSSKRYHNLRRRPRLLNAWNEYRRLATTLRGGA